MIDTHAHLDYETFGQEQESLVRRAEEAGLQSIVTVGIDMISSRKAVELADRFSIVYAAIGIHPNDAGVMNPEICKQLRELATHPKVVAFGETGLDYYWNKTDEAIQKHVFWQTIELAAEFQKPLIIHNRDAHEDILSVLHEAVVQYPGLTGVMHCFSGNQAYLQKVNALGWYISFAGNLTYKKSILPFFVPQVPADRILIETDAPFLAPVPHRGKRNEPAYLRYINDALAAALTISADEAAHLTTENACRLFRLTGRMQASNN